MIKLFNGKFHRTDENTIEKKNSKTLLGTNNIKVYKDWGSCYLVSLNTGKKNFLFNK